MGKRNLTWVLGIGLLLVFVSLIGLQYIYYTRIISLRKEQTSAMAQLALQELARDIEVKELVRYLNIELNSSSAPNNALMEALRKIRQEKIEVIGTARIQNPKHVRDVDSLRYKEYFDSLAVSDKILQAFIDDHSLLDEYILRNLYRVYSYDSVAQLVKPRFLKENLMHKLEERDVRVPYSVSLCSAEGRELFRYTQPGMRMRPSREENAVVQRIFINREYPNKLTPFIRLSLDFDDLHQEILRFALPGVLITLAIIFAGIMALVFVSRQLSFQVIKTDFINNMTHELKTPVSSILLSVEQMQRLPNAGLLPEEQAKRKRYLTIMEDEAQRLRMLIDKVLQIALYDRDRRDKLITLSEVSLDEIIFKAAKIFSVHVAKYQGELILEHEADNTWIMGSETHMTNVLYNLLENAIKYRTEERKPEIILKTYNNAAGELVISVEDNGHGVPETDIKRIFERFYRVSTGLTHNVKGHGLGLAYVHSIVKQFGGKIAAYNKASGGLIMLITLPTLQEDLG